MFSFKVLRTIVILSISYVLFACNGDDGDGPIGTGESVIEGTVAVGDAVQNKTVTLKDSTGKRITTQTALDGSYRFDDIAVLTPPYYLKVDLNENRSLYSTTISRGSANIHVLTDLMVRNWFKTQNPGVDIDDAFRSPDAFATPIQDNELQATLDVVKSLLRLAYIKFDIPATFDFLRHKFIAKHTKPNNDLVEGSEFDHLLDHIDVKIEDDEITITLQDPITGIEGTILVQFNLGQRLARLDQKAPSDPSGITILPGGNQNFVLLWNASIDDVGVAGYRIYKTTENQLRGETPYPVFVDEFNWQANQEYCYFIEAFDAADNASQKTRACFTETDVVDKNPPLPATNLVTSAIGSFAINVSWVPSPDDVIGYDVYRKMTGEADYSKVSTVVASVLDDKLLLADSEYCYYVEAIKIITVDGDSTYSTVRSVPSNTDCVKTNPSAPNDDNVAPVTTATPDAGIVYTQPVFVTLVCTDSGGSGCADIHYTIDGSDPTTVSPVYQNPIEIASSTVLKFFAVDQAGNTESINVESYAINLPPVPAIPQNVSGSAANKIINLQWDPVTYALLYNVYMSSSSDVSTTNYEGMQSIANTNLSWSNLTDGKNYYFVVTATNASGESDGSAVVKLNNITINNAAIRDTGSRQYYVYELYPNDTTVNRQEYVSAEFLTDGRFVVGWQSANQPSGSDVWGKVYSADAVQESGEFMLNPFNNSGWEYGPSFGALPGGGFVVTWGDTSAQEYGQLFDVNRSPLGTDFLISSVVSWPAVASTQNGDFVVAVDYINSPFQIYGRRFNSTAAAYGPAFQANQTSPGARVLAPAVAMAANGEFTIAWHQDSTGNIMARRYLADGSVNGDEFVVNSTTGGARKLPSLAYATDNKLVFAWFITANSEVDVFMRIFAANGTAITDDFTPAESTVGDQANIHIATNESNDIVAAWRVIESGTFDVHARIFDFAGTALSNEFLVNHHTTGHQTFSQVGGRKSVAAAGDKFIFTWEGERPSDSYGIGVTVMQLK